MKKTLTAIVLILLLLSTSACSESGRKTSSPSETARLSAEQNEVSSAQAEASESPSQSEPVYAFEFKDIDGQTHKLSDYSGRPVYLRVWASWCGVCTSSLDKLNKLAGESKDFTVLTVVMPEISGEMSAENFTKWFKDLRYENIVVLLDPNAQVADDFGINAFPSQIMFDAEGHPVYGAVGLMSNDDIKKVMADIAKGLI